VKRQLLLSSEDIFVPSFDVFFRGRVGDIFFSSSSFMLTFRVVVVVVLYYNVD
jgi:hypothetical protein